LDGAYRRLRIRKETFVFHKLLTLLFLSGLSALALAPRANAFNYPPPGWCECAPLGGEYCGSDGVTYDSPCMAGCAGATVVHSGPC
jgi:hypothetical protein